MFMPVGGIERPDGPEVEATVSNGDLRAEGNSPVA